ncbi:hypothetical protein [Acinetobacter sp. ANC 4470]|nr:hypothetical protein [Acinetobacter sp. ANC 4470]
MKIQQVNETWSNWSGSQKASPQIFQPRHGLKTCFPLFWEGRD